MRFRILCYATILITLAFLSTANASNVRTVEITVEGSGATYGDAVNDALTEAIAQRSGRSIATQTNLTSVVSSVSSANGSNAVAAETLARQIQTATKGEVQGYRLLEQGKDDRGLVIVKLAVQVAEFVKSPQTDRLRIAVSKVRVSSGNGDVGDQIEASAKSALTDTRKFAVLDRDWEKEYSKEMELLTSGSAAKIESARLGQRLGADLLLVTTVQQIRVNVPSGDTGLLEAAASATCNFSLVDAATGMVKVSKTFTTKINQVQAKQAGGSAEQIALALANSIGKQQAELVVEASYPLMVVSVQGQDIVINQGGDRIKMGQTYEVFALGEVIIDPQTGESLGRPEKLVGRATVNRVTPKMAYATVDQSTVDITPNMILRYPSIPKKEATTKPKLLNDW